MKNNDPRGIFSRFLDSILQLGLGDSLLRVGTGILSLLLLGAVIVLLRMPTTRAVAGAGGEVEATAVVPAVGAAGGGGVPEAAVNAYDGVPRLAQERTIIPS
ncbi:hypothetical protein FBQ81_18920, partial [Chloroflexi bacterium CFX6]|nr:hypothetical protein [Chloroflexi bacterium CFX6]